MLSFVVAIAKNNVIGRNNHLPWHLPADVRFFKNVTLSGSKTMIMGRRTFESLPKVLPGRKHFILTTNKNYQAPADDNVSVFHSVEEILQVIDPKQEYFIIGGSKIFELFFPYVDRLYITEIHEDFEGDTVFPPFNMKEWELVSREKGLKNEENPYDYEFLVYERKRA